MDEDRSRKAAGIIGVGCHRLDPEGLSEVAGALIAEEPLLISVAGRPAVTLMCTPGDEISLALGFLRTEGVIASEKEIGSVAFCREEEGNVVRVFPAQGADLVSRLATYRTVYSSCSICGREAIRSVTSCLTPFVRPEGRLSSRAIIDLGEVMNQKQRFFGPTGGTHAAVLGQIRDRSLVRETVILKEDIGRHNALDKVIGEALLRNVPFGESVLFLSGRISFEMVAKAARAGIADVAAISAPTALAVELAEKLGMLLVGFARGKSAYVYSGKEALSSC